MSKLKSIDLFAGAKKGFSDDYKGMSRGTLTFKIKLNLQIRFS